MELIQEIGSYAGFAAVLGLAVLSALYFSQARDVRRLRDWAGRAPERDADARSRVAAAGAGPARPTPAAQPATPATAGANNTGAVKAPPVGGAKPATAAAATAAGAAGVTGAGVSAASAGSGPLRGGVASPPRPIPGRPSNQNTQILAAHDRPDEPWYRRIAPRYIALIVAGVLVIGGGVAVGVLGLLSSDNGGSAEPRQAASSGDDAAEPEAPTIQPADVSVAVYNGTLINGLGNETAKKVENLGFDKNSVGNAPPEGQKAESVVFYAPGKKREAQLVRRKLKSVNIDISNIEPIDDVFEPLQGTADVVVVVGANATQ